MPIYYDICSDIYWHNQISNNDIKLEKKLGTRSWHWHVNMGIFGVSVVDTYIISTQSLTYEDTSCVFFSDFSEEIIKIIWIEGQPDRHQKEPGEARHISLLEPDQLCISNGHAKKTAEW